MKKFLFSVLIITFVGLMVVTFEVEAVKTGYDIRKLNLEKREVIDEVKQLEYQLSTLKSPYNLNLWMASSDTNLSNRKVMRLAKVDHRPEAGESSLHGNQVSRMFAKIFVGTAQANAEQ